MGEGELEILKYLQPFFRIQKERKKLTVSN